MKLKLQDMKLKSLITNLVSICLLVYLFIGLFAQSAIAHDFQTQIDPSIVSIEAKPPARISIPITLENKSDKATTYGIYLRPFKADPGKNGIPNYDPKLASEYKAFFENVQINDGEQDITDLSLSPGESKDLSLKIHVPTGTASQDRYFTVVFLTNNQAEESKTNTSIVRGAVGTNVLLTIGSETEAKGEIVKFSSPKLITHGPVPFTLELANNSSFFVASKGTVVIKNMFGQIVGNLEFGPLNILANSSRLATNGTDSGSGLSWDEEYPIGFYKVEAKIALSEHGPLLMKDTYFFAFPFKAILIFGAAVITLVWLFRRVRQKASE